MKEGYVYLLCNPLEECYKIGVTTGTIEERMKKLQTGSSNEIHIVSYFKSAAPFKLESLLHAKYSTKRKVGEWFELEPEQVFEFKKVCEEKEKTIESLKDNPWFWE